MVTITFPTTNDAARACLFLRLHGITDYHFIGTPHITLPKAIATQAEVIIGWHTEAA